MLHLFRNYNPFTVLILFIAAFIMKMQALSHPVMPIALPDHLVFASILQGLDYFFHGSAFAYTLLAVVLIFSQALYINHITVRHRLFLKNNYFPAFAYLLLTSIAPAFNYFSEPLLVNWLVLIAVNMMLTFNQNLQPRKQIFNAGFMICLPALIQFPSIGFILLFILALLLLRSFNIGEWVVGTMGYLTPIYFFATILFLIDRLPVLIRNYHIGFSIPRHLVHPVYMVGTLCGIFLLAVIGSYSLQQQIAKMTIYIRRSWALMYCYLIVSVAVTLIAISAVNAEWLILMPALSLIIAHAFCIEKSKRFSNFTFYFSLLLLIFCQLTLNK